MKNAIRALALTLFLVMAGSADLQAQIQEWWGAVTYQTALSAGDTKDFVDQFSWRNVGIEGRGMVKENVSVGAFFGWNVFNEEVDGTASLGAVDVSGYQSRFVNALPMLATAHVYMGQSSSGSRGYLGLGVGTYYIENRAELGVTAITADAWHFGLAPEVGISLPTSSSAATYLNVKYNYAFEANGFSHAYWTFGIGVASKKF